MNTSVYARRVTSWIVNWNLRKPAAAVYRESRNILDTQYPFSLLSFSPNTRVPFFYALLSATLSLTTLHRHPYKYIYRLPYFQHRTTRERLLFFVFFFPPFYISFLLYIIIIYDEGFNAIKISFRLRSSRGRIIIFYFIRKMAPFLGTQ